MTDPADEPVGLQRVRELVAGTRPLPGMWRTLGLRPVAADPGRARVEVVPGERHHNGSAMVHGGLIAALIDSAAGAAMATTLPAGQRVATVDLKVDYLRPAPVAGGALVAAAEVTHAGRMVGHASARVTTRDGRLIATGRAVFAVAPVTADRPGLLAE